MRYFFTLLWLQFKATAKGTAFAVAAGFTVLLVVLLAALLPQGGRMSLGVGVLATEAPQAQQVMELLLENGDYSFQAYESRTELEQDVLAGKIHCGYQLQGSAEKPLALGTAAAYMRPLLDELVLAACFEVGMPERVAAYLEQAGLDSAGAGAAYEQVCLQSTPMTVALQQTGHSPPIPALAQNSVQPLLYAVLASTFFVAALLAMLLARPAAQRVQRQLAVRSERPFSTLAAPVVAQVLLNTAVLLAADLLMNCFVQGTVYTMQARLAALLLLAAGTGVLTLAATPLRRFSGTVAALLPLLLLVSVVCSGALVSTALLPAGLGVLRFASPAWYCLRILSLG